MSSLNLDQKEVNQGVQSFMDSSQESSLLGSPIDGCQEVQSVGELSQGVRSLSRSPVCQGVQSPSESSLSGSLVCQGVQLFVRKFSPSGTQINMSSIW